MAYKGQERIAPHRIVIILPQTGCTKMVWWPPMGWNSMLVFPLILIVSALSLPVAAAGPQDKAVIKRGDKLVESRCVVCHTRESLPKLVQRCVSRQSTEYLHAFLKRHHAPDDQARADIIAFLTCIPVEPQAK